MKKIISKKQDKLDLQLVEAIRQDDIDSVRKLMIDGANPSADNWGENNALYIAISLQKDKIVNYMLNSGIKLNPFLVLRAIQNKDIKTLKKLVQLGAKLDHELEILDPIMMSINTDNLEALKYLVSEGADISKKMSPASYLFSALHHNCSEKMLDYLLAQKNLDLDSPFCLKGLDNPYNGLSPIEYAIKDNKILVAQKILKAGGKLPLNCKYIQDMNSFEKVKDFVKITESLKNLNDKEIGKALMDALENCDRKTLQELINDNEKKYIKILNKVSKSFSQIESKFMKFPIKFHAKFKFEGNKTPLIITSQLCKDELDMQYNLPNLKKKCATKFSKGEIYSCSTNLRIKDCKEAVYVISKEGNLFIEPSNVVRHSYILKGKKGDELYGYGKPVACAGHLDIENGKIAKISNYSGHYQPNPDQIKLASIHLKDKGVLDQKVVIDIRDYNEMNYDDLDTVLVGEILDQYAAVEY